MATRESKGTTAPNYLNRNRQRVVRATALPGTDHLQSCPSIRGMTWSAVKSVTDCVSRQ